jgi:hypothetical protein
MRLVAAGCLSLVALAACSDTPVSPSALRSQAVHFDSLATVLAKHVGEDHTRVDNLQIIATALAHGATPGVVTMTIAGAPVTVHLVGIEGVDSASVATGLVLAVGWVDADADTSIFVSAQQLTSGFIDQSVTLAVGDSSEGTGTYPPQFAYSWQPSGTRCTNYPITNDVAGPSALCHLALGTLSFNVVPTTFEGSPLLVPVGAAIVSPSVTFGIAQLAGNGF